MEADHCPVAFPWFAFTKRRHDVDSLHLLSLSKPPGQRWVRALLVVTWPLTSIRRAARLARKRGPEVRDKRGMSLLAQWWASTRMALRHNVTAESFYEYELWGEEGDRVHAYLQHHEILRLMPPIQDGLDAEIHDKVRFFQACRAAGIATPEIFVVVRPDGGLEWLGSQQELPGQDLFLKPSDKWRATGAERWQLTGDRTWERAGRRLDERGLLEHIRSHADGSEFIVQPCEQNHPSVEDLSNGSVVTLRLQTCRVPGRPTTWFQPMLKMPTGTGEVNQLHHGGIYTAVGPDGMLAAGVVDGSIDRVTHHPDTGAPIEGRVLPGMKEMVDLAVRTHETIGGPYFVGWDVLYTPAGASMLEGNPTWGVIALQRSHRRPLGEQPVFLEGYRAALEHAKGRGSE